jgi:hypothetical protein
MLSWTHLQPPYVHIGERVDCASIRDLESIHVQIYIFMTTYIRLYTLLRGEEKRLIEGY